MLFFSYIPTQLFQKYVKEMTQFSSSSSKLFKIKTQTNVALLLLPGSDRMIVHNCPWSLSPPLLPFPPISLSSLSSFPPISLPIPIFPWLNPTGRGRWPAHTESGSARAGMPGWNWTGGQIFFKFDLRGPDDTFGLKRPNTDSTHG